MVCGHIDKIFSVEGTDQSPSKYKLAMKPNPKNKSRVGIPQALQPFLETIASNRL